MNHLRLSRGLLRTFESLVKQRCTHTARVTPRTAQSSILRAALSSPPRAWNATQRRWNSGLTAGGGERTAQEAAESEDRWANTPAYELNFTCKRCNTPSKHKISKQGYHHGTVLVNCPGCKNKHLISDHLKIFSDKRITLEDIMKEKGQLIKKGNLSAEGDVEFWDDGTEVRHDA